MVNANKNLVDRAIEYVAPMWAIKRDAAREALAIQRGYDAGGNGRRQRAVDRQNRSAAMETMDSLDKIRGFARFLEMNTPQVARAIEIRANHIIGTGIRPAFEAKTPLNKSLYESVWKKWAESTQCDLEGRHTFYALQRLACMAYDRDGEFLIVRRKVKNGYLPYKLQLLEADQLDHTKNEQTKTGEIVQGIEYADGVIVAYWLHKAHPNGTLFSLYWDIIRIPAEDVIHVANLIRPGQARGVSKGVQSFLGINDLAEYQDAEVVGKKVQAAMAVVVTSAEGAIAPSGGTKWDRSSRRIEPGTMTWVPPGDKIETVNPSKTEGYESFVRVMDRRIAMSYSVTYEALAGDYSMVNYSSARMARNEVNASYDAAQYLVIIPQLCNRVFEWMSEAAQIAGLVRDTPEVSWTPPGRPMVDPEKEVEGLISEVQAGFTSFQEAARSRGWNIDELMKEIESDRKLMAKYGIMFSSDPGYEIALKTAGAASKDTAKKSKSG